jgi:hypothetical protein
MGFVIVLIVHGARLMNLMQDLSFETRFLITPSYKSSFFGVILPACSNIKRVGPAKKNRDPFRPRYFKTFWIN